MHLEEWPVLLLTLKLSSIVSCVKLLRIYRDSLLQASVIIYFRNACFIIFAVVIVNCSLIVDIVSSTVNASFLLCFVKLCIQRFTDANTLWKFIHIHAYIDCVSFLDYWYVYNIHDMFLISYFVADFTLLWLLLQQYAAGWCKSHLKVILLVVFIKSIKELEQIDKAFID